MRCSCLRSPRGWIGRWFLLLLLSAISLEAGAQPFQAHVVTNEVPLVQDVAAADVNGDGDTDLLALSFEDDALLWYERRADSSFTEHLIADGLDGAYTIHAADLTGNGAVDVLVGTLRGGNVWQFQNDGTGRFGSGQVINDEAVVPYDVSAATIDGDDRADVLVAAHGQGHVLWYPNDGEGGFGARRSLTANAAGVRDVAAGDLTGNGRTDVVSAAADDGIVAWHENTGTGFRRHVVQRDADGVAGVHVADVAGDDAPDLLSAALGADEVTLHETVGTGTFEERTIDAEAIGAQSVTAADVGEDGTVDVLAALREDDRITLYEQSDEGRFRRQTLSAAADGASSVEAVDLDGDGDTDVVAASQGDGTIRWFETNLAPAARDTAFQVSEDRTLRVAAPGVLGTDWDPDGDSLTARRLTAPRAGTMIAFDETGGFSYRADAFDELGEGERRSLPFRYEVRDPAGRADTARVELSVVGENDRPRARSDVDTTAAGTVVTTPILANDDDVDGRLRPTSVSVASLPAHGSVAAADSGTIAYTPDPAFAGEDRYTYTVRDDAGGVDTASVTVRVRPPGPRALRGEGREGGVRLRWRGPPVDRLQAYRVYRSAPGGTEPGSLVETLSDPSRSAYVVSGLSDRRVYTFAVTAVADSGLEGGADTVRAVPRPPQVPLRGTVSFGPVDETTGYRMVGLPGTPKDRELSGILDGTAGDDWTAFAAPGVTEADDLVGYRDDASTFDFRRGRGFWVLSGAAWAPEGEVDRIPLDDRVTAALPLPAGWSVITNPFPDPVPWARVQRATPGFDRSLWGFDGQFSTRAQFDPYEGYYVFNDPDAPVDSLRVPYPIEDDTASTRGRGRLRSAAAEDGLRLRAERPDGGETSSLLNEVRIQVQENASAGRDRFDRFVPPPVGRAPGLQLVLRNEEVSAHYPWLRREARPRTDEATTFELRLSGPPGAAARLLAEGLGAEREATLYDPRTEQTFDLRDGAPVLQVPTGPDDRRARRLELWVGPPESLDERRRATAPSTFRLAAPTPNPTRAAAQLRYTVPDRAAPAEVRLTVFDLLGRTVQRLVEGRRAAGRHVVAWNGRDEQGRPVASGVYFCRLVADGRTVETRKITVVR